MNQLELNFNTNKKKKLTENQFTASHNIDKSFAVTAGAGCGKTEVLVNRYIEILKNINTEDAIDKILCITFTEKAAVEMRSRIELYIKNIIKEPIIHKYPWKIWLSKLKNAYISTIHSFCSRIIREYSQLINPDFIVSSNLQSSIIAYESVQKAIDLIFSNKSQNCSRDDIKNLAKYWTTRQLLVDAIVTIILQRTKFIKFFEKWKSIDIEKLKIELQNYFVSNQYEDFNRLIEKSGLINNIKTELGTLYRNKDTYTKLFEDINNISKVNNRNSIELLDELMLTASGRPRTGFRQIFGFPKNSPKNEIEINFINYSKKYFDIRKTFQFEYDINLELITFKGINSLLNLLKESLEQFEIKKNLNGLLDFSDLEEKTYQFIQNNDFKDVVNSKFDHILIDEFQDTNQLQWEILQPFLNQDKGKLFIVGDDKQSIYGFRNAEVELFRKIRKNDIELIDLKINFRSNPQLIDFINHLFSKIISEDGMEYISLTPSRNSRNINDERNEIKELSSVSFVFTNHLKDEDENQGHFKEFKSIEQRQMESEAIALWIKNIIEDNDKFNIWLKNSDSSPDLYRKPELKDIAILIRRKKIIKELKHSLKKHQIPFIILSGTDLWDTQEFFDIINILTFLINKKNDISLWGFLRSLWIGISDEGLYLLSLSEGETLWEKIETAAANNKNIVLNDFEKIKYAYDLISKWNKLINSLGPSSLLLTIVNDLRLINLSKEIKNKQALDISISTEDIKEIYDNIEKILSLAFDFEKSNPYGELTDFLNYLKIGENFYINSNLETVNNDKNAIKILTIHAAKGLEFPIVIIPEISKEIRVTKEKYIIEPEYGIGLSALIEAKKETELDSIIYKYLLRLRRQKEISEEKRVFYVGCTRAKDHLTLVGSYDSKESLTKFNWINKTCNFESINFNNIKNDQKFIIHQLSDKLKMIITTPLMLKNKELDDN